MQMDEFFAEAFDIITKNQDDKVRYWCETYKKESGLSGLIRRLLWMRMRLSKRLLQRKEGESFHYQINGREGRGKEITSC